MSGSVAKEYKDEDDMDLVINFLFSIFEHFTNDEYVDARVKALYRREGITQDFIDRYK